MTALAGTYHKQHYTSCMFMLSRDFSTLPKCLFVTDGVAILATGEKHKSQPVLCRLLAMNARTAAERDS